MKRNKAILDFLIKKRLIDVSDFYNISFSEYDITLQGYFNICVKKYGIGARVNDHGHANNTYKIGRSKINIVMTS